MLYLVATPIGNLGDITMRALDTLKDVDFIACEDTRKTMKLLNRYEIKKPLLSFFEHNEEKSGNKIISILQTGQSVALVTDGGTPGISDPGFTLIRKAIQSGIEIISIPGPTALIDALILSGLAVHSFIFRGFPPHKPGSRKNFLKKDIDSSYTLIYYESPHRIKKFLQDAIEIFGNRKACIANDLTKLFETVLRGDLSELLTKLEETKIKGEYTVVIEGNKLKNNKK